ncbi:MAG: hypothetical protein ACRES3_00470, partial [Steroidobacteraceae bacterium]
RLRASSNFLVEFFSGVPAMAESDSAGDLFYRHGKPMVVTKLEAARRQLNTAIQLSFAERDPVSIHALAYASYDIIHRLFRCQGHKDDLVFDTKELPEKQREAWNKSIKDAPNFFKHANRGKDDESIRFLPGLSDVFMLHSLYALRKMHVKLTPTEVAYSIWGALHFPSEFFAKFLADKGLDTDRVQYLKGTTRPEFYKAFLRHVQEGGQR